MLDDIYIHQWYWVTSTTASLATICKDQLASEQQHKEKAQSSSHSMQECLAEASLQVGDFDALPSDDEGCGHSYDNDNDNKGVGDEDNSSDDESSDEDDAQPHPVISQYFQPSSHT
ncbi:hypothetical protein HYDPIDRAFT_34278 [Hydnomerulius pinastri MD-312]|uniref:Uncharacterized protein n=1 Tax=Hydnomerulius pinastri MD-312 TaxID=994086 RepID=A0A0C9W7E7_9AGAM|nr:hypothetical protein HYDPIDRAFT_34278 [Hydnomerulius pinastri MD-312]